jgi:hypothetical protein
MTRFIVALVGCLGLMTSGLGAQETTGAVEGAVTDQTASALVGARVVAINLETGFTKEAITASDGFYRLLLLPVGHYTITVEAPKFATLIREAIEVNLGQTVRVNAQLALPTIAETVTVSGGAQLVDTSTNALGRVVTGRELVDLPLNGRNFTQLGLLQTGVAPLTAGVATAGGSLRQGQAYAVNGMRPESNMYLVDGGQNVNRMDGGYALKLPVEAIAEFRILTQSAPPEYGGTGGATTSGGDPLGQQSVPRQSLRVPPQRCLRRAELLLRGGRATQAEPVRRHHRRADRAEPAAVFRLLRRLPQQAGIHDDGHGAERLAASG